MLIPCLVVDQYVVEEYQDVLPQLSYKDMIHARLESGRCIGQPKQHDQEIKMTEMEYECGILYIMLSDVDLMISRL
jgi:hypothetical protein